MMQTGILQGRRVTAHCSQCSGQQSNLLATFTSYLGDQAVSNTCQDFDATILVSNNYPFIGENVAIIFLTPLQ